MLTKHKKGWLSHLIPNLPQALQFGKWGGIGAGIGSLVGESMIIDRTAIPPSLQSTIALAIRTGLWFGIIGGCISIALLMGHAWFLKKKLQVGRSIKQGALPGFMAGCIAGAIAQLTYTTIGPTEVLRVICWGVAGGLLGIGLSFRIPNLGKWQGFVGGFVGGVLGGVLFILLTLLIGEVVGRLLGLVTIGFLIGLMIALAEAIFREAWLVVHWSPSEQKTISLGARPISLGSSDEATIYLRKDQGFPPIAAKIFLENDKVIMQYDEEMRTRKSMQQLRHELKDGDRRKLGDVILEVKTVTQIPQERRKLKQ